MTASRITYSTILSQARENIYDIINSASNVADPISSSAQTRKWIYSRFPDVKASNFTGYPFIILTPANVTYSEDRGKSLDLKSNIVEWSIEINIYASDRSYNGGSEGNGYIHITDISDDIVKTFNDVAIKKTLMTNNIQFANIKSTSNDVEDIDKERIFYQSFMLTFRTKMQVSA